jgi:hypothetical protein
VPKLTDDYVSKLKVPPGKRDVLAFDTEVRGFGVRKFASGKAYFLVKYNVGGKQRRQSLKGEWAPGTVSKMRAFAVEVKARASLGQDLVAERKAAKVQATATTLGNLVPEYLKARESESAAQQHAGGDALPQASLVAPTWHADQRHHTGQRRGRGRCNRNQQRQVNG